MSRSDQIGKLAQGNDSEYTTSLRPSVQLLRLLRRLYLYARLCLPNGQQNCSVLRLSEYMQSCKANKRVCPSATGFPFAN